MAKGVGEGMAAADRDGGGHHRPRPWQRRWVVAPTSAGGGRPHCDGGGVVPRENDDGLGCMPGSSVRVLCAAVSLGGPAVVTTLFVHVK